MPSIVTSCCKFCGHTLWPKASCGILIQQLSFFLIVYIILSFIYSLISFHREPFLLSQRALFIPWVEIRSCSWDNDYHQLSCDLGLVCLLMNHHSSSQTSGITFNSFTPPRSCQLPSKSPPELPTDSSVMIRERL